MADLKVDGFLSKGFEVCSDEWTREEIRSELYELKLSAFSIEHFMSFLTEHNQPDDSVRYTLESRPRSLERMDTGNLVAKLLRFMRDIDDVSCDHGFASGLLKAELELLGSATFHLLGFYFADLCQRYVDKKIDFARPEKKSVTK